MTKKDMSGFGWGGGVFGRKVTESLFSAFVDSMGRKKTRSSQAVGVLVIERSHRKKRHLNDIKKKPIKGRRSGANLVKRLVLIHALPSKGGLFGGVSRVNERRKTKQYGARR